MIERTTNLAGSARSALAWSVGYTIVSDTLQFGTMLVLVRLLSPQDYGNAALAQSIIGFVSVFSCGTFVLHAFQLRNAADVDWQAHFTAALAINTPLFFVALLLAWGLSLTETYHSAALPLAGLAVVLLIDAVGTLRHRMLQVHHEWKRFNLLQLAGGLLGSSVGLLVALAGGGVWALLVQIPLSGVPAAADLFLHGRWRPDWSFSWSGYRETVQFALSRISSIAVLRGRQASEQALLAGTYDFAALGVFTRTVGLATMLAGRIGAVAVTSLYPVITRTEQGSAQFQRFSGLVLRGVSWVTIAAAIFLALSARDLVTLLYGEQWTTVAPLLPWAAAGVGSMGIANAANNMLLANNGARACLVVDAAHSALVVAAAFLLIPYGMAVYLAALAVLGVMVLGLTVWLLWFNGGISPRAILSALAPAILAGLAAAAAVMLARTWLGSSDMRAGRLAMELAIFAVVYIGVLRLCFPTPLRELLGVAPGGGRIGQLIHLESAAV